MSAQPCRRESSPEKNFRRQLAATVRSINWSYAIFWTLSSTQEGILAWKDGFYNGDIKTRKTTQPVEYDAEQIGLQRSEQLRELFESLSTGEGAQENIRPSPSLCPDDLTDAEWYYLVCMSFTFTSGQCLPGKAFANNHHVWLGNAQSADSNSFLRSLLAKSASIQTVICLPFNGGVLELGTTKLVSEDLSLIEHVKNDFWEIITPSVQPMSSSPMATEKDTIFDDHECPNSTSLPFDEQQIHRRDTVNGSCSIQHSDEQKLVDDAFTCDLDQYPANSNEFISYYFPETILSPSSNHMLSDTVTDNSHYAKTLATISRNSKQVAIFPSIPKNSDESSFRYWHSSLNAHVPTRKTNRNMPRRVLVDLSWAPGGHATKSRGKNATAERVLKSEGDDAGANHVLSERRRREKLNEKFITLRSLLPSITKVDKTSILSDTIEYVKELKRRVEELECYKISADIDARSKRKNTDTAEGTSDNYGCRDVSKTPNPSKKRKFSAIDEFEIESRAKSSKDVHGRNKINVELIDNEVLVNLYCPWRESLLLKVAEAVNSIQLDAHSLQYSVTEGHFSLTLRAEFKGSTMPSPGLIKMTLQRILSMC